MPLTNSSQSSVWSFESVPYAPDVDRGVRIELTFLAPDAGLEPATRRLEVSCSSTELIRLGATILRLVAHHLQLTILRNLPLHRLA